jgi:hypothetical protein
MPPTYNLSVVKQAIIDLPRQPGPSPKLDSSAVRRARLLDARWRPDTETYKASAAAFKKRLVPASLRRST